jgi:tRNA nucleotidyltransferase (CCA-adding enzyme)
MRKKERWSKKTLYQTGLSIALMAEHIFSIFEQKDPTNELNKITSIYHSLPIKHRSELSVNGNDLIQWENKKSGPWVKQRLELIEEAVINGIVQNEKEQIRKWLYS